MNMYFYPTLSKKEHSQAKTAKIVRFSLKKNKTKKLSGKSAHLFSFAVFGASSIGRIKRHTSFENLFSSVFIICNRFLEYQSFLLCCINFCPKQSCPGKCVKKMLPLEKNLFYQFSDLKLLFFYFLPLLS